MGEAWKTKTNGMDRWNALQQRSTHTLEMMYRRRCRSFAIVEAFHGPTSMEDCPAKTRLPNNVRRTETLEWTDGRSEPNWQLPILQR